MKFFNDVGSHVDLIETINDTEQQILKNFTKYNDNEKIQRWEHEEEKINKKWPLHEDKKTKERKRAFFHNADCCKVASKKVENLDTPAVQKKLETEMSKLSELSEKHAEARAAVRVNQEQINRKKCAIITNVYQLQYVLELMEKHRDHHQNPKTPLYNNFKLDLFLFHLMFLTAWTNLPRLLATSSRGPIDEY